MSNRICSANLNIFNETLRVEMFFSPGLNIISGENGTLKTQVLHALKNGYAVAKDPTKSLRIQAISPKRNSERRTFDQISQLFRSQNKTWESDVSERLASQVNLTGFNTYPSLADLYYLLFTHRCKDGENQKNHMKAVADEFNLAIQTVFPNYKIVAAWDDARGMPQPKVSKNGNEPIEISSLSIGELEVLSLLMNLATNVDNVDAYLIDEPEVHLNWHLEERLFTFLDELCENKGKQAIVVTHSRVIFKEKFYSKSQFLSWGDDNKIRVDRTLSYEKLRHLAGDAVEIVGLGDFKKPTFFVEDQVHSDFVQALATHLNKDVAISKCGNSQNVKSLFQHQQSRGSWENSYFLLDGDNQGSQFPSIPNYIHIPVYCIENVLLDPDALASLSGKTSAIVRSVIADVIKSKRTELFKKNKFLEFLVDGIKGDDITFERLATFDGSVIASAVFHSLGFSDFESQLEKYFVAAKTMDRFNVIIPAGLVAALST
jgi:hypothetical protein